MKFPETNYACARDILFRNFKRWPIINAIKSLATGIKARRVLFSGPSSIALTATTQQRPEKKNLCRGHAKKDARHKFPRAIRLKIRLGKSYGSPFCKYREPRARMIYARFPKKKGQSRTKEISKSAISSLLIYTKDDSCKRVANEGQKRR